MNTKLNKAKCNSDSRISSKGLFYLLFVNLLMSVALAFFRPKAKLGI